MPEPSRTRAGTLLPLAWWKDPRTLALSSSSRDLLTRMLSYSADEMTDGRVPRNVAAMLVAADQLNGEAALDELINKGELRVVSDDVLLLVRWHDFNLSRQQVEEMRAQRVAAGQKGGVSRITGALRDPASGHLLRDQPAVAPDASPVGRQGDTPGVRLGERQDGADVKHQTDNQTRLPSPVSRPPTSDVRSSSTVARAARVSAGTTHVPPVGFRTSAQGLSDPSGPVPQHLETARNPASSKAISAPAQAPDPSVATVNAGRKSTQGIGSAGAGAESKSLADRARAALADPATDPAVRAGAELMLSYDDLRPPSQANRSSSGARPT